MCTCIYTYEGSCLSVQYDALCIIIDTKRTIPVTVYHLLLYGSLSAPCIWQKSKCFQLVAIRAPSRWAPWRNILQMFRQFCGAFSIAHLCQSNAANVIYTASWDDTGIPWAAQSMTLDWWRRASLIAAVYFPFELKYHMHANYCCGTYNLRMSSEWGFLWLYFRETYFV